MKNPISALACALIICVVPVFLHSEPAEESGKVSVTLNALLGTESTSSRGYSVVVGASAFVDFPSLFIVRAAMDRNVAYDIRSYSAGFEYSPLSFLSVKAGTARVQYNTLDSGYDFVEAALELHSRTGFRFAIGWLYSSLSFGGYSAIYPFGNSNGLDDAVYSLPTVYCSLPVFRTSSASCELALYSKNILFSQADSLINTKLSFHMKLTDSIQVSASTAAGFRGLSGLLFGFESIRFEAGVGYAW